jgi:hypothetical protein
MDNKPRDMLGGLASAPVFSSLQTPEDTGQATLHPVLTGAERPPLYADSQLIADFSGPILMRLNHCRPSHTAPCTRLQLSPPYAKVKLSL